MKKEVIIEGELQLPHRNRQPSVQLKDYYDYDVNPKCTSSNTISSSGMTSHILNFLSYDQFSPKHQSYLESITNDKDPKSYS